MPTAAASCGCEYFPNGVADQYKVTFSGFSNDMTCGFCSGLNGDFILDRLLANVCTWQYTFPSPVCGVTTWQLKFVQDGSGFKLEVVGTGLTFRLTSITSALEASYSPPLVTGTKCNAVNVTCTVVPIAFTRDASSAAKWKCLPAMQAGIAAPGTLKNPYSLPPLAASPGVDGYTQWTGNGPATAGATGNYPLAMSHVSVGIGNPRESGPGGGFSGGGGGGGGGPAGCGCTIAGDAGIGGGNNPTHGFRTISEHTESGMTPGAWAIFRPGAGGPATTGTGCSCPVAPGGDLPTAQVLQGGGAPIMMTESVAQTACGCGGGPGGCAQVTSPSLSSGNNSYSLSTPNAGPLAPVVNLTYNTLNAATSSEFGYGWNMNFNPKIVGTTSGSVTLTTIAGANYQYWNKNVSNWYQTPAGVTSALKLNGDNTWTEYPPSGNQYTYDTGGKLVSMVNPSGARWTVTRDGGGRVSFITDPANRRTTISYDVSNKIQQVKDPYGRTTDFSVNGSGNLTSVTTPELCVTNFGYDGSHRMTSVTDPESNTTTSSYDSFDWLTATQYPTGAIVTYAWPDMSTATVTDPNGGVTTLTYNTNRNVTGIVQPTNLRVTLAWLENKLSSFMDGAGNIYSLSYSSVDNRTPRLASVQSPLSDLVTMGYDSANNVTSTLTSPSAAVSTLVWDTGNRTAIVNADGYRTSFTYTARGQVETIKDALANTVTVIYDSSTGEPTAMLDVLGNRTSYTHSNGQLASIQNPLGYVATFVRDNMNRITAVVDALGFRTTYAYNLNGQQTSIMNSLF